MPVTTAGDSLRSRPHKPEPTLSAGSVQVGLESIYYAASGVAEAGAAVLFLHQSGASGATWYSQLAGLARKARCLAPDLPGHGQSVGLGYASVSDYRRAMLGFLDALAIHWPVVIAGVCLGAAIAVDMALHAPERVAGLVLAGVNDGGRATPEDYARTARGEAPERFVRELFAESVSQRLLQDEIRRWRVASPAVRHSDLSAMARYPLREALQRVTHPVLLLGGEADPLAPQALLTDLAAATRSGQLALVPGAGCLAMVEQPDRFNRLVSTFVERVPRGEPLAASPGYRGGGRRSQ